MRTPTCRRSHAPDGAAQHRGWLELIEISGPFLSLPVLRRTWPTLEALEKPTRDALRREHAAWRDDPDDGWERWVEWVLTGLLGWGDELRQSADELDVFALEVPEHDARVVPTFALVEPDEDAKPATTRLLGLVCPPGHSPTARVPGSPWAATYVDRVAAVCRHHGVELGLVSDGRWWALVWAPKDKATGVAVFDTIAWPEAAERDVVRAFVSLLGRVRFFGVPDGERLPALLSESLGSQEEITEALGSQVREAVELLVAALGRQDIVAQERGLPSLEMVDAHEVYRGAVSVMMRIVFLLFAEERRLLPADNDLYASTYSAGTLLQDLEERVAEGSEDDLEHTTVAWHRLLAVFAAVHGGIEHPRLTMHPHDGSLFDPDNYPWLDMPIDDRTVLHMLRAVQTVQIGTGRLKERRTLSFRSLGVEEIGYVYEGLLAYDAFRAVDVVVGLTGKRGSEPEVELGELEHLASFHHDTTTLGAELASRFKDSGLGTGSAIAKKMKPLTGATAEEARRKLLAAAQGDARLADRLTPFFGLLRQDLRELPMVFAPGALYVTDSPRRRNTGTHYTPRELAEEVVLHALEPLVYERGPLQTAETSEWKLKTAKEILELNVADIAMGSAAFLVAAARYLGARLIEAWTREGDEGAVIYSISEIKSDEDPLVVEARRQVIENCLYGVDINPMAVEMAKLSLWLISMDPVRPFTFLDDRLIAGDSLLGIRSIDQLEQMSLDLRGRVDDDLLGWTTAIRGLVEQSASTRRFISLTPTSEPPTAALAEKRDLLIEAWTRLSQADLVADLLVGAYVAGQKSLTQGNSRDRTEKTRLEALVHAINLRQGTGQRAAIERARTWLATDQSNADENFRSTVHWPLVFPEVFARSGFDCIVGNPPFLGGKRISSALGSAYREYLVTHIASNVTGNADLVAYFLLRGLSLLNSNGQLGLITTNTLAQGDTREVGLDQAAEISFLRRAERSRHWPTRSAALDFSTVWISKRALSGDARYICDGAAAVRITPALEPESRVTGNPSRLAANARTVFQGSNVVGAGFVLDGELRQVLIDADPSSVRVIRPFLNAQDVSSAADLQASRWIIDFGDMSETQARQHHSAYEHVKCYVKPQRDLLPDYKRRVRENWWKYEHQAKPLYASIEGSQRCLAIPLVSKYVAPVIVETGQVFSHKLAIVTGDVDFMFPIVSSNLHFWWAVRYGSTLETRINYSPTDIFETFPLPEPSEELIRLGRELANFRFDVMKKLDLGMTALYNRICDQTCDDHSIIVLREKIRSVDGALVDAYDWGNRLAAIGGLDHGFHSVGREIRYTIGPAAQREVLDNLLELNHERYAEEAVRGLHDKKKGRSRKQASEQEGMFDAE